jgi:hypothetical protein
MSTYSRGSGRNRLSRQPSGCLGEKSRPTGEGQADTPSAALASDLVQICRSLPLASVTPDFAGAGA